MVPLRRAAGVRSGGLARFAYPAGVVPGVLRGLRMLLAVGLPLVALMPPLAAAEPSGPRPPGVPSERPRELSHEPPRARPGPPPMIAPGGGPPREAWRDLSPEQRRNLIENLGAQRRQGPPPPPPPPPGAEPPEGPRAGNGPGVDGGGSRRLSPEERRALRQQVREAHQQQRRAQQGR